MFISLIFLVMLICKSLVIFLELQHSYRSVLSIIIILNIKLSVNMVKTVNMTKVKRTASLCTVQ
jgi:hypothetical protein